MTGKAQTAHKQLPSNVRDGTYTDLVQALRQRFEPDGRRDVYVAEFRTKKKKKNETWADFGDSISSLVEKAYPELTTEGKQQLALR